MARGLATDYIHSMRFQVIANPTDSGINDATLMGTPDAGFSAVTTPEATIEAVEYKEGNFVYTRKYPGNPSMSDITMSRGVTRGDSSFWDWLRLVLEGAKGFPQADYRIDLDINHFHREGSLIRNFPADGTQKNQTILNFDNPGRVYHVFECFPIRHKVAGDLDATASEISIMELDISYEHFEVEEKQAPA